MSEIQEYSQTEAALGELRETFKGAVFEVETSQGMNQAREARAEIKGYRVDLEKTRKAIKAPALDHCRKIDAEAKRITNELVMLEEPIDKQIKVEENRKEKERQAKIDAERARVRDIQVRIEAIRAAVDLVKKSAPGADDIQVRIDDLAAIVIDESFAEFQNDATVAQIEAITELGEYLVAQRNRELEDKRLAAEREELDRLRAEQDERDRVALEARRKEQEKIDKANRKALAAQEKREADLAMREKKIRDEENRQAQEKADKEAAAAKEETDKRERQEAKQRTEYPGAIAIVDCLSDHFGVSDEIVVEWLAEFYNREPLPSRA